MRPNSARVIYASPRTSKSPGKFPLRRSGIAPQKRYRFFVISSPCLPSPRVSNLDKTPSSYTADIPQPSIFGSTVYVKSSSVFRNLRSRASNSSSSSGEKVLSRLSMGARCPTFLKPSDESSPTLLVGDLSEANCGYALSSASRRRIISSNSASEISGTALLYKASCLSIKASSLRISASASAGSISKSTVPRALFKCRLPSGLPVPAHLVFVYAKLLKSHGTAGVQFVC